ncbi:LysR family transcriptional regulator [Aurantimicrobium photophilum]|uniref:Nodulation protein D 2 n=1 Tax=Aurantimicrobium photophilum TaxID=1987356 RepID=A0A2Z3RVS4_9MICO|nr:LysR family transcriptional regulator [Aurantimicrobium photophilum]AWR20670.1 Nodulation protein D 2 [Aurantimicrobium photophilum]
MTFAGKDLNLLIALRALLEEANVTRAGDRIQMGQSSMSSALSRLRTQFGDELLVRVGRDYELTPLARLLLPQIQMTLPLIEQALGSEAPFDPQTSYRTFTLMMSDFAALELKNVFALALLAAPEIRIDLLPLPTNPTDSQRDLLKNDFIAAVPGIGIEGEHSELFVDEYVCLIDKDNPALVDGQLTWEAFTNLPQAVCDFGQAHLTPADRKLRELGFSREAHVKTTSFMPLPSVVSGTELVAIVPKRLADRFASTSNTIGVPTPFDKVVIIQTLWWHASHNTDPAHVWLRNILTSTAPAAIN